MSGDIMQLALRRCRRNYMPRVVRPDAPLPRGCRGSMQRKQEEELLRQRQCGSSSRKRERSRSNASHSDRPAQQEREAATSAERGGGAVAISSATEADVQPAQEVSPVLYDGSPQFHIVRAGQAVLRATGPAPPKFILGEACANSCKGRSIVAARCESLDDYDKIAASPAVRGCVVSQFENGFFALVFKRPSYEFKALIGCAISKCRLASSLVRQTFELFSSTAHRGDVELEEVACGKAGEIPLFEEAMEALKGTTSGGLNALSANAKRAKTMKQGTPLQKAVLCYGPELKDEIKHREDSEAMIFDVRKPGPHFLDNFVKQKVLALRGVHCECNGGRLEIRETTFRKAMEEPAGKGKPPLYLLKTLIFNGVAGGGETEFVHGVARECCKRSHKDVYSCSNSLCPLGIMTKSGRVKDLGAVCFEDFEMNTRGGTHFLTREERKSLLYVKQRAHYHAFYHQAILHEFVPRLWSVNYGMKEGTVDKTEWFARQGMEGLRLLAAADEAQLNLADEHAKAEARRAVIFYVDEQLFPEDAEGASDAAGVEIWRALQENATPMD